MNAKLICLILFLSSTFALEALPGFHHPWGKDSDIKLPTVKREENTSLLAKGAEKIIWFHQNIISPVDGPRSHFRPSSSEYMRLAIKKYGFFKGYIKGCDRLLRENSDPWIYR